MVGAFYFVDDGRSNNNMRNINKNKHLTKAEREIIETGIRNGSTKVSIADTLGKDKSTITKEIKTHRYLKSRCPMPLECSNYKKCRYGRKCKNDCIDYEPFKCNRRDRSPGACNGCGNYNRCRFNKYLYSADIADKEYRKKLVSSREGLNITKEESNELSKVIVPLIKKGQSIEQILAGHPEISLSIKTIYNYIEAGLFKDYGLLDIDLRRKVSRKITKKRNNLYKKREDRSFMIGHLYSDYLSYIETNPDAKVIQMDTVYNDISNGPFIQTFKFLEYGLLFGIYHDEKTSKAMNDGIILLEDILGDRFFNIIDVILTDRGSEFYGLKDIEYKDDLHIFNFFYCDPMCSNQKGSLENKHEELRYILPKECNLYELGLTSQVALNEVLSHIDSSPRVKLNNKSPLELVHFLDEDLYKRLIKFGIKEIPKDEIILKPYLIKKFKK